MQDEFIKSDWFQVVTAAQQNSMIQETADHYDQDAAYGDALETAKEFRKQHQKVWDEMGRAVYALHRSITVRPTEDNCLKSVQAVIQRLRNSST